jgi:hypothetical protein
MRVASLRLTHIIMRFMRVASLRLTHIIMRFMRDMYLIHIYLFTPQC